MCTNNSLCGIVIPMKEIFDAIRVYNQVMNEIIHSLKNEPDITESMFIRFNELANQHKANVERAIEDYAHKKILEHLKNG